MILNFIVALTGSIHNRTFAVRVTLKPSAKTSNIYRASQKNVNKFEKVWLGSEVR